jgi:hypothetical protein
MASVLSTSVSRWLVFLIACADRELWQVKESDRKESTLRFDCANITGGVSENLSDAEQQENNYRRIISANCHHKRKLFIPKSQYIV